MEKNDYLKQVESILGIEMIPCESSNLEGYGYSSSQNELWVAFKNNRVYRYDKVPHDIANGLHEASSKGKYLNQYIKGKFEETGYELQK